MLYFFVAFKKYTKLGYQKVSTPTKLHESLVKFYQSANKHQEDWKRRDTTPNTMTYFNHWEANSQLIDFSSDSGEKMRTFIWDEAQSVLEHWSGLNLSPSTLYGRVYTNQSVIPPHVDAEPFVISAIIRVAQEDMNDPWIIEMIGHDRKAYNMSLGAGEMLLYEGASVIHGRPFAMNGTSTSVSVIGYFLHIKEFSRSY